MAEGLHDVDWFSRKRARTRLPKLHRMIDYAEVLQGLLEGGNRQVWVRRRYENLVRIIEQNVTG